MKMCSYTWSTRPADPKKWAAGAHYDHACVNAPVKGGQCGGPHLCRDWNCTETHS